MSNTRTISDNTFQYLLNKIMTLKLKPGEMIDMKNLIAELNVSRSPIRDAINSLSNIGLITIYPQKGTQVSLIDLNRIHEERFVRATLEQSIIPLIIERITRDDILVFENIINLQKIALAQKDIEDFFTYDNAFHEHIFKCADKEATWQLIMQFSINYRRLRLLSINFSTTMSRIIDEHQNIVEAIRAKDKNLISDLFYNHLHHLEEDTQYFIDNYPEYFSKEGVKR